MNPPVVSVDGVLLPADARGVSAFDRGVLLGDGLFETMRGRNGRVFRLEPHLARLASGLGVAGIPVPPALRDWIAAAVAASANPDVRVRVSVTRGASQQAGLAPPAGVTPTVIIGVWPGTALTAEVGAITLHVASGRRNERAMSAGLKALSYLDGVLATREAQQHEADEALFLDTNDHCAETAISNLFVVTAGALVTPPLSCGILPGITRAVVIELADALGLRVAERAFGLDVLLAADEAFVTNASRGPAAISAVDGRAVGSGSAAGPVTRRLAAAWRELVQRECP